MKNSNAHLAPPSGAGFRILPQPRSPPPHPPASRPGQAPAALLDDRMGNTWAIGDKKQNKQKSFLKIRAGSVHGWRIFASLEEKQIDGCLKQRRGSSPSLIGKPLSHRLERPQEWQTASPRSEECS